MRDRLDAARRVMTRIRAPLVARKVPARDTRRCEPALVALARDQHDRPGRHAGANARAYVFDEFAIARGTFWPCVLPPCTRDVRAVPTTPRPSRRAGRHRGAP